MVKDLVDSNFYKNFGPFSLLEISKELNCDFHGDENFLVKDVSPLSSACRNSISFFSNKKYLNVFEKSDAGTFIVEKRYAKNKKKNYIFSNNPHFSFAKIARKFYPDSIYTDFFLKKEDNKLSHNNNIKASNNVFVHNSVILGKNVVIGANSVIGPGVSIGDDCIIGDNVSIYFSIISKNVKILPGSRIGTDGFGFAIEKTNFLKIPQIGRVLIHENVEIGANVTIDRGSCGDTIIKKNSMIDNLVHIAHNVEIGENCIIAGMTGISGSVKIGKNVIMGGQVGLGGHITIGDNVKIAAKSGVFRSLKGNNSYGGFPAQKIREWHKMSIFLKKKMKNV